MGCLGVGKGGPIGGDSWVATGGAPGPWGQRRFLLPAARQSWNHGPSKDSRICPDPLLHKQVQYARKGFTHRHSKSRMKGEQV